MSRMSAWVGDRPFLAWSIPLGLFALALFVRLFIGDALPPGFPYLTFFPAVILTAFLAGLRPGIVCAILSGIAAWYFFVAPANSFALSGNSALALAFYAFIVTVDLSVIHFMYVSLRQLRDEETRAALAIEGGQLGLWEWDLASGDIDANDRLRELLDIPEGSITADQAFDRIHEEDLPRVSEQMREAGVSGKLVETRFRISELGGTRTSGSVRWIGVRGTTDRGRMLGVTWDETELLQALERSRLLARELDHRVKNLFAVILSLVTLSGRGETDVTRALTKVRDRIHALSLAHSITQGHDDLDTVALRNILMATLEPYEMRETRILFDGPEIDLPHHAVTPIGLITHELATNAAKYGALSVARGHLALTWRTEADADGLRVRLSWRERGGPAVSCPESDTDELPGGTGFGSLMIRQSVRQLGGRADYDWSVDGVCVDVVFPLHG